MGAEAADCENFMTLAELWQDWRVSVLLASLCWGVWGVFGKVSVARLGWPTTMVLGWVVGMLAVAPVVARGFHWPGFVASWPACLYGLGGALGALLLVRALERGPAVAVLPLSELWLVVNTLLAVVVLGEDITWLRGLGLLLVMAGAALLAK